MSRFLVALGKTVFALFIIGGLTFGAQTASSAVITSSSGLCYFMSSCHDSGCDSACTFPWRGTCVPFFDGDDWDCYCECRFET